MERTNKFLEFKIKAIELSNQRGSLIKLTGTQNLKLKNLAKNLTYSKN